MRRTPRDAQVHVRPWRLTGVLVVVLGVAAGLATDAVRSRAARAAGEAEASVGKAAKPASSPPPIAGPPELLERARNARAALGPLKKDLMSTLQSALAGGSPEAAVDACRLAAPAIAERAGNDVYTVGRTSTRPRNPDNAPAPWMRPLLDAYGDDPPRPGAGTVVALEGDRIGYVEPIYVKSLCTTCHGTSIDPSLLAHIRERYPEDRAVGYETGDFRGLFWVVGEPAP